MFYFLIFFILCILSLIELFFYDKKKKVVIYVIIFTSFILLSGLRWNTGNDWLPYYSFFKSDVISALLRFQIFEPGFAYFVSIIRGWTDSYTIYLIIFATTVIACKGVFFYKYTNSIILAALLFWCSYLAEITAVRQSIAISICLLSIPFIIKKNVFLFFCLVFLAMQFHISAFIFLLAYPVYYANWSVSFRVTLLIFSLALGLIGSASILLKVVSSIVLPGNLSLIAGKAYAYVDAQDAVYVSSMSKGMMLFMGIMKRSIILPFMLFNENSINKVNDKYKGFLNLFVFGNCIYFLVNEILAIQRNAAYFYPLEVILLCLIFQYSNKKIFLYPILVAYGFMKLLFFLKSSWDLHVPYIWIFSEDTYRKMY